jgi:hypothetical protein
MIANTPSPASCTGYCRFHCILLVLAAAGFTVNVTAATVAQMQVAQYGITWTFDRPAPVGRFVNGDFYVVGPVKVVAVDPKPLLGTEVPAEELGQREKQSRARDRRYVRNGSMLNPPALREVGCDSGVRNFFNPDLTSVPPLDLKPGDVLLSTISLKAGEAAEFPYHSSNKVRDQHDNSPVKTAAILTCVAEAPPADAFRPAYADREQRLYLARNLQRGRLPRLPPPPNTPDLVTWIRIFERPWVNPCTFGFEQPMDNMPHYGQWVGQAQSTAGLLLMLDLPVEQKERLLIHMVQVGIDYWGLVRSGHPGWEGHGGHGSGRKFPIVFAGLLLGDAEMAAPTKSFPKVEFGEDNQTMYGEGWTGARALFAGHSGISNATGKPSRPKWGPYEHLHPSQWSASQRQSEAYRRANTSSSWVGQALVIRLLGAEEQWNHDAFLDYVDRWMTEPNDDRHRAEIMKHHAGFRLDARARHTHQGNTWEPFVKTMWERHRAVVRSP